jgi:gliding motility-associated-like protein
MYRWVLMIWALSFLPLINAKAQNTSNKGKEFWIAYTGHIDGTNSRMYLYITSDVNTTADVSVGGLSIAGSPFAITANTVQAVPIDPSAYVGTSDVIETGKAIEVIAAKPVVVYAHIFRAARSGATLVLPTKVLGREYYTTAYTQNKGGGGGGNGSGFSEFTIVAVEDNTVVEITPKAGDIAGNHTAGVPFQKTLQKGQIYQYLSDIDLSGSHIVSVAGSNGMCKPIAVFSGSTWVGFCGDNIASGSGGDNLYQQLYPITAWGKEFITAPFIRKPHDIFRVYFSKDNTILTLNGITNPVPFNKGTFFEFTATQANSIKASEPISVVQYQISQGCDPANAGFNNNNAPNPGDPEMTVLNPVEQTLSKITVYSARQNQTNPATNITQHYINVIIRDEFKASLTINGLAPLGTFVSIAGTGYSYLQEDVTLRSAINPTHTLMADGGFSAIAYGYGGVESYGYLAGADAKNLFENVQISDASTAVQKTNVCVGETAAFTLILPYMPDKLTWTFDGIEETAINSPIADGSDLINGVTVYKFKYGQNIPFTQPMLHQIKAMVLNPNPSGCDPNEEIVSDFEVFALPAGKFSSSATQTCAGVPITFNDESSPNGMDIVKWHWNFGDGSATIIKRSAAPFEYTYLNGGTYQVTLWVESESGCSSTPTDPITINVNKLPVAEFKYSTPSCETKPIAFTDHSVSEEGIITKWSWNFGDINASGSNPNFSIDQNPAHTFSVPGTYNVTLVVVTDKGCVSVITTHQVIINKLPQSDFETPDACVNDVSVTFRNTSVNSVSGLTYVWDFGDPASATLNGSTDMDGVHKYTAAGDYDVKLTVITPEGCSFTKTKRFRVNGAIPSASFELLTTGNLCSNKEIVVKDKSTIAGFDNITRLEWYIDGRMVEGKPNPVKEDTYILNYPVFTSPLTKPAELKLIVYSGNVNGPCRNEYKETLTMHAAPSVNFEALTPICINAGKVQFVPELTGDATGTGVFSGKGINNEGIFDPLRAGLGTWSITYTYTGDNGCVDVAVKSVVVNSIPDVNIPSDLYAFIDGTIQVNATVTEPGLRFKWTPSKGLNRDNILNPIITADDDRVYTLTVTSTLNCDRTVFVRLHALREIIPPNAFSPNNDGVNDVWKLNYLESYPNSTIDIFNRYGEKVFFSQGYSIPFDGNYKGNPLPVGTYYYIINPKNGRKTITGSVTLIR